MSATAITLNTKYILTTTWNPCARECTGSRLWWSKLDTTVQSLTRGPREHDAWTPQEYLQSAGVAGRPECVV